MLHLVEKGRDGNGSGELRYQGGLAAGGDGLFHGSFFMALGLWQSVHDNRSRQPAYSK